ncbi:MAG: hypothetical protein R3339_12385, partial [Thermodesulfobacteriota bacterium]|nr:hypothetical protein [Thermodesulfobacteriota bacterium]
MKTIHYKPLLDSPPLQETPEILPLEVFSEVIFQNTSLEDALEELRREGYRDPSGTKLLPGIGDLLKHIKEMREALSAEGEGPVKSGVSHHKDTRTGSARIQSTSSEEKPFAKSNLLDKLTALEKSIKRVYWGFDP